MKAIGPQGPITIKPTLPDSEDQLLAISPAVETNFQELSKTESAQLRSLLAEYIDLFAQLDSDLDYTEVVTHSINTRDHPPIQQLPQRISFALRKKVEEMVDKMLHQGVVQSSKSPLASPIVLVAKTAPPGFVSITGSLMLSRR